MTLKLNKLVQEVPGTQRGELLTRYIISDLIFCLAFLSLKKIILIHLLLYIKWQDKNKKI